MINGSLLAVASLSLSTTVLLALVSTSLVPVARGLSLAGLLTCCSKRRESFVDDNNCELKLVKLSET